MLTKSQKVQAYEMFLNGLSYETIGNVFGVRGEAIRRLFWNQKPRKKPGCVYPCILDWIKERGISTTKFASDVGISRQAFYNKLKGENDFTLSNIKSILAYTGLTFEEAFGQKENT